MTAASVSGHLHHFLLLNCEQQGKAIRRMANTGWSDSSIAAATRLSVEQVRRILAKSTGEVAGHG